MKHKRNIVLPVLIVPALLAFATVGDELGFHPGDGATLRMTYTNTSEVSLDEMSLTQNGQEVDPAMLGGMEMTTTSKQVVVVTDVYGGTTDGRPAKITRTFETLSSTSKISQSNAMMGDSDTDVASSSELEDKTVIFTWNGEADAYDVRFDEDSTGNDELLEGLEADLSFRELLPSSEVSADDAWDIDPEAVRSIFAPGGALKFVTESLEELGMSGPQPSPDQFLGDLEGEVSGTYGGTRDEGGVKVGVVHLKVNISSAKDLTELMEEMMSEMEIPGAEDMDVSIDAFDMEFAFEGEGDLLWNVEAGVIHSLELSGEVNQIIDMAMAMSVAGMDLSMENSMTMSGSMTIEVVTGSKD